jgi:hypothetical protein
VEGIKAKDKLERNLQNENLIAPCGLYCGECLGFQDGRCDGCISRKGLCLKYSKICHIYECCVVERKYRVCAECKDLPCDKIDAFFETPEWHDEVMNNLNKMSEIGIEQFLKNQTKQVMELIKCAGRNGIKHCSQCKDWPCEKLGRPPLVPA